MRIAQIAPIIERVPPLKYGGTERVVHVLTEELVKQGHEVTLYATGDSVTSARLVSIYPQALREQPFKNMYSFNTWTLLHSGIAYSQQERFDIIHDHNGFLNLALANIALTPTVITMHGPFLADNLPLFQLLSKPYVVTISHAQAATAPDIHTLGTVHNGLFLERYPFSPHHQGYLLFVGRICFDKGVHVVVEVARRLKLPLIIAAKLEDMNRSYFEKYIKPHLNGLIRWIGEVTEEQRNELYSGAMAFLHPAMWEEPFGLTLIEAMACGCPVIAFGKGAIPEVVAHGTTGFVVDTIEDMVEAVKCVGMIKRETCRTYVLANFTSQKMAQQYEALYQKILETQQD